MSADRIAERLRLRQPLFSVVVGGPEAKVGDVLVQPAASLHPLGASYWLGSMFGVLQIGELHVRRTDNPYDISYRFVRDNNLRYEFVVEVMMIFVFVVGACFGHQEWDWPMFSSVWTVEQLCKLVKERLATALEQERAREEESRRQGNLKFVGLAAHHPVLWVPRRRLFVRTIDCFASDGTCFLENRKVKTT